MEKYNDGFAVSEHLVLRQAMEHEIHPFAAKFTKSAPIVTFIREDEVKFTGLSTVVSVDLITEASRTIQKVTFGELRFFDQPHELQTLAGGLEKVSNFLQPERHFQIRDVIKLSGRDIETIETNLPELPRSVFRFLFSMLPMQLRAEFVAENYKSFDLDHKGQLTAYTKLALILVDHIEASLGAELFLLDQLSKAMESTSSEIPEVENISLSKERSKKIIPIGLLAKNASVTIQGNALFTVQAEKGAPALLQVARELLSKTESKNTWNDSIF